MIEISLPWPPSINHYWRTAVIKGHAQTYISAEGKHYRSLVWHAVKRHKLPTLLGRLNVHIVARPPDKRIRDLDNVLKSLLDALARADVYVDDGQIDVLYIRRSVPSSGGMVEVCITEIQDLVAMGQRNADIVPRSILYIEGSP